MNNLVKISDTAKKNDSNANSKEVRRVDINNIIKFAEVKKYALHGSSLVLSAFAIAFASATCFGHLYEPEVPEQLR